MYLGLDEHGRQQFRWVGRFATKRERDDAVARARTERRWEAQPAGDGLTCNQWADRLLGRMESGAHRTNVGRRFKASSIDTARSSLKTFRAEFGERIPGSITRVEAEDWAARVSPSKLPAVITLMNELYRAEVIDRTASRASAGAARAAGTCGLRARTRWCCCSRAARRWATTRL